MSEESAPDARYQIEGSIGAGGAGQVFRAWDQHLQRHVAIKRLRTDVEMDANLRREAGILAALHHPNIVTIYDFASDEEGQFAVMEYVEGSTLEETVAHQPLTVPAFVELANQVCRGLSAAHSRGLVHLDLKAGNLMIQAHEDRSFTCKILDFGIAHLQNEARVEADDGSVLGTPATVAPEQLRREPVDARTDIYSLGCVFYLALSGREPFGAAEVQEMLQMHLYGAPKPLHLVVPGVPEPLARVIARMTARQPAERPQSMEEVRQQIQNAMRAPSALNRARPQAGPAGARAAGARPAPARPAAKGGGGGGMTALVMALLALASFGFLFYRYQHPSAPPPESTPAPAAAYPALDPLDAPAAARLRGQTVTVEGVVTACEESQLFGAQLLKFSGSKDAVAVSVDDKQLNADTARGLVGKRIRATGQLSAAANRTRVIVGSMNDLKVAQ